MGWVISSGYDANSGFYDENDNWIQFPEDVSKRLRFLTFLSVSWKRRLKFLIFNKEESL